MAQKDMAYGPQGYIEMDFIKIWSGFRGTMTALALSQGKKYKLTFSGRYWDGTGKGAWNVLHEVKAFRLLKKKDEYGDDAYDFEAIIRDFISSQFSDGEKMDAKIVSDHLWHAEPAGDARKYHEFSRVPGISYATREGRDIPAMIEEILINLFCETENEARVLIEENRSFSWKRVD